MTISKRFLTLLFSTLLLAYSQTVFSTEEQAVSIDELNGQALHEKLVETALKYDFYNKRCRGISVSGESYQVERMFLKKYGLTINNFIKQYIDRDTRGYKEKLKKDIYLQLSQMGGCEKAKEKGLLKAFQENLQSLFDKAETSQWFPIEP
ncbi:hypothetical protein QCB45_02395 [Thiomicrorhabdus sp. ZW0627]|uniref:hypothetical protein n=1 Tax=Thiomicrorhabdus sp. ZW0627 TaxID=3039774 RepID=UPI002436970C|nr:hypothetical protein [Thiomicrorhabdus sp. ZW0627]MDG6773166.1 hypothetical protein [Thiomicrorhabdus sp. ZW0627]